MKIEHLLALRAADEDARAQQLLKDCIALEEIEIDKRNAFDLSEAEAQDLVARYEQEIAAQNAAIAELRKAAERLQKDLNW